MACFMGSQKFIWHECVAYLDGKLKTSQYHTLRVQLLLGFGWSAGWHFSLVLLGLERSGWRDASLAGWLA